MTTFTILADGSTSPMPIEIDSIVCFITWFHKTFPVVGIAFITVLFDIIFGLYAACVTRTLSSTISQRGMVGKAIQVTWMGLGGLLEPYSGMPLSGMIAAFFIVTNLISITENSARAGVPVPPAVLEWLQRLRNNEKASVAKVPQNSPTVNIQRASNVDIHTTEVSHDATPGADTTTTTTTTIESSNVAGK